MRRPPPTLRKKRLAGVPVSKRLRYDPVRGSCHYLTVGGGLVRIDAINPYCLLYILRKLDEEGKQESRLYNVVQAEARRCGALKYHQQAEMITLGG
jgi:hypothetical protein